MALLVVVEAMNMLVDQANGRWECQVKKKKNFVAGAESVVWHEATLTQTTKLALPSCLNRTIVDSESTKKHFLSCLKNYASLTLGINIIGS